MIKLLLKAKPVLHGIAILLSAVISGITAIQMGGSPEVGIVVGGLANTAVAIVSSGN